MKIFGTGIDIVEVIRIRKAVEANKGFRNRVFTQEEIKYCEHKKRKFEHYAVRFAAKEAVWKAFGQGGVALRSIEIVNDANGKPSVRLHVKLKACGLRKRAEVVLSMSHTHRYAVANAIVVEQA